MIADIAERARGARPVVALRGSAERPDRDGPTGLTAATGCIEGGGSSRRARIATARDNDAMANPARPPLPRLVAGFGAAVILAMFAAGPVLAHGVTVAAPDLSTLILGWSFDPLLQLGILGSTALYLLAVRRVDRAHPDNPVPLVRVVLFLAGIATIELALASVIERYDDTLFSDHMVQHALLMLVAPPLIALGAPITLALRAASPDVRKRVVLPILRSRVIRFLAHPIVAWLLFAAVSWGTHFSPIFDLALENDTIHNAEHLAYLSSALLFWWPVIGVDPSPWRMPFPARILYVLLMMPMMSFLSLAIYSAPDPLYPHYATIGRTWGPSPLVDQQAAGAIMWVWADMTGLVALIGVMAAWLRDEEARTSRSEARADARLAELREREARLADRLALERADGAPTDTG